MQKSQDESIHAYRQVNDVCFIDASVTSDISLPCLQELAGLKEEKAELKAQLYLMEKEKSSLDLRLEGKETHENVLRTQIHLLHTELREIKDPSSRQPNVSHLCSLITLCVSSLLF